jgi:hypothetical protein
MPLAPAVLKVSVENPHYIRFRMEDGDKSVTVHVATSWLRERASKDRRNTSNLKLLYNYYREMIEAAASAKYDRSHAAGADVVVVGSDLE